MTTNLSELVTRGTRPGHEMAVHASAGAATWDELRAQVAAIELPVEPGQPVCVCLPNGVELVATLFAVWRAGAVYVPLNPRATEAERAKIIDRIDPAAIVTVDGIEARPSSATFDPDTALIQFTSGTTGDPKAVQLTHSGVAKLLDGVIATLKTSDADKTPMPNLVPVSLSLWAGIYQVLFAYTIGAGVIVMDGFAPAEFARLVQQFGIRSTVLPPAAMTSLADDPDVSDLTPLKYVRSITAPLSPLQARRFVDKFGTAVLNCWGQTEIGGEIVGWSAADWKEFHTTKLGAVGRPHRGVQIRAEENGELVVMTPALSAGYADGRDFSDRLTADGWFRTGDIGSVDDDGFVWIDGRVSDMINRGGLKVHPGEVEEVLRLHPSIADAAVVGVPDDRLGEVPWAFVVLADAAELDPPALEAAIRESLAPYKVPVRFEPIAALPRNEVGKVLHRTLVQLAT